MVTATLKRKRKTRPRHSGAVEAQRRFEQLRETPIRFIDSPEFGGPRAEAEITSPLPRLPEQRNLPPGARDPRLAGATVAAMCRTPLLKPSEERELFRRMNYCKFRAATLLSEIETADPEDLHAVEALLAEADAIRNRIMEANVRLAVSVVTRYADQRNTFDELLSEGVASILQAVESFDYSRGYRFSTYATRAIRCNLFRWLNRRQKDRQRQCATAPEDLPEPPAPTPYDDAVLRRKAQLPLVLDRLIAELDPREQHIIRSRFALRDDGQVHTLQALAGELGISKERVRQLEGRAMQKLKALADRESMQFESIG